MRVDFREEVDHVLSGDGLGGSGTHRADSGVLQWRSRLGLEVRLNDERTALNYQLVALG